MWHIHRLTASYSLLSPYIYFTSSFDASAVSNFPLHTRLFSRYLSALSESDQRRCMWCFSIRSTRPVTTTNQCTTLSRSQNALLIPPVMHSDENFWLEAGEWDLEADSQRHAWIQHLVQVSGRVHRASAGFLSNPRTITAATSRDGVHHCEQLSRKLKLILTYSPGFVSYFKGSIRGLNPAQIMFFQGVKCGNKYCNSF